MNSLPLEDSIGDIVRKARTSLEISTEAAASASSLSASEYQQLEDSAIAPSHLRWGPLAQLLTLNGRNLEALAKGWQPIPIETNTWKNFRMITSAGDGMTVNAYMVWDPESREAALFDTGFDASPIVQLIEDNHLVLKYLMITHSHADHIAALAPLRQRFPQAILRSSIKAAPIEQHNRPGEILSVGRLQIAHRMTPGHADDGVTYVVTGWLNQASPVAIVGDAIFCGSMGGAKQLLALARTKVREEIFSLPDGSLLCSGHGPLTTVGEQRRCNPWF